MNKINEIGNIFNTRQIQGLNGNISISSESVSVGKSFKDCLSDMIVEMNEVTNKPKELTKDAMLGKADVHDVMAAVAQSELTVQAAATVTGKILQTYEKIMQIQI